MADKPKSPAKMQVIGVGLCRTGTTSFTQAMEILGLGPCYHMRALFKKGDSPKWVRYAEDPKNLGMLDEILEGSGFQSSCDVPSSVYWQEQLLLYPDAKVVLTTRDAEKWYQSCEDTVFKMFRNHPCAPLEVTLCYWFGLMPRGFGDMLDATTYQRLFHSDWSKTNVIECYEEHNRNVIENCPKPKLLVLEASQGWEPLCTFLDVPIPDVPYPHANDTKSCQEQQAGIERMGYMALTVFSAGVMAVAVASYYNSTGSLSVLADVTSAFSARK